MSTPVQLIATMSRAIREIEKVADIRVVKMHPNDWAAVTGKTPAHAPTILQSCLTQVDTPNPLVFGHSIEIDSTVRSGHPLIEVIV